MMSALTRNELAVLVRRRLGAPVADRLRFIPLIDLALQNLAREVKDTKDRHLLTTTITNQTPVAGVLDLSGAGFANMLPDTFRLPGAISTFAESDLVFKHAPSIDALRATTPVDAKCVWYFLRNRASLVFKNPADGTLNTYATALNLTGNYVPILGDVNFPLDAVLNSALVEAVVRIVNQGAPADFLKTDEEMATQTQ